MNRISIPSVHSRLGRMAIATYGPLDSRALLATLRFQSKWYELPNFVLRVEVRVVILFRTYEKRELCLR